MEKPSSATGTHFQSYGSVLMRYHSAPSSVLADLLHSEDALLSHVEDSRLAQICMLDAPPNVQNAAEKTHAEYAAVPGHIPNCISGRIQQVPNAISSSFLQQCRGSSTAQTGRQLGSIFQQPQMISCDNLQSSAQNAQNYVVGAKAAGLGFGPPIVQPFASGNGNLVRQSSFPADILSRLGIEDDDEGSNQGFAENLQCHGNVMTFSRAAETMPLDNGRFAEMELEIAGDNMSTAHLPLNGITDAYLACNNGSNSQISLQGTGWFEGTEPCFGKGSSVNGKNKALHANDVTVAAGHKIQSIHSASSVDQSSLFRHNSLPASLLSQLSFDGASEKLSMTSSSGNSSEDGGPHLTSQLSGLWDEEGGVTVAFGQRKRARGVEDRAANKLCTLDSIQGCPEKDILVWKIGGQEGASSLGHLSCADDSVLCKVRAKRGCATHPRSIAERVRRTKISEAMRKLQELVPNMEKQTNTATMLDEAVNYVKFLKQQVQKLSENQANCTGSCDMMNKE